MTLAQKIFGASMVDIANAGNVSITIDRNKNGAQLWVDDENGCRTRMYGITNLTITDRRTDRPADED